MSDPPPVRTLDPGWETRLREARDSKGDLMVVYLLRDGRNGRIAFVGASSHPGRQLSKNLYLANNTFTLGPLYRWLRQLQREEVRPEIVPLELTAKSEAPARIVYWKAALPWAPAEPYRHTRKANSPHAYMKAGLFEVLHHILRNAPPTRSRRGEDPHVVNLKRKIRLYAPQPIGSTRTLPPENDDNQPEISPLEHLVRNPI